MEVAYIDSFRFFNPSSDSCNPPTMWLKYYYDYTAEFDSSCDVISHTSTDNNLANGDRVNIWRDYTTNNHDATAADCAKSPFIDENEYWKLRFDGSADYMSLSSAVSISGSAAYSIVITFKFNTVSMGDGMTILGHDGDNRIMFTAANVITLSTNGATHNFTNGAGSFATDRYYTLVIEREAGGSGDTQAYVWDHTANNETTWGAKEETTNTLTISQIGISDPAEPGDYFNGWIGQVIIYPCRLNIDADRTDIYNSAEATMSI